MPDVSILGMEEVDEGGKVMLFDRVTGRVNARDTILTVLRVYQEKVVGGFHPADKDAWEKLVWRFCEWLRKQGIYVTQHLNIVKKEPSLYCSRCPADFITEEK